MKITFLGTGHGLHEKGRYRTSMMLEVGGSAYLIDAGSPVMHQLINNDRALKEIRAVFITHTHNDHLMNVLEMVDAISCTTTGASIDFYIPEQNAIDAIKGYLMVTAEEVEAEVIVVRRITLGILYLIAVVITGRVLAVVGIPSRSLLDTGRH